MRAYRGILLNPRSETDCAFYPDGLLVVDDAGRVAAIGNIQSVSQRFDARALEIVESNPPPLILPAFTDVHLHWVQNRIRGSAKGQGLLRWLDDCVWPEEALFAGVEYAKQAAAEFFADLARHGTMVGCVYSSVHETALEAFRPPFGHFLVGNVLMTENCPPTLQQKAEDVLAITRKWAEKATIGFAVSPRFALTCSMDVMKQAAGIAQRHNCVIQTHLAENLEEVALVHQRFPDCRSYTEVYQRAGLLGPRTILGHCIYLDDDELAILKAADAVIAHCPTSNEALGSGRMPIERIQNAGIRWALATDIAAGPSLSMLHVMKTFLRVHAAAGFRFSPTEALYRATLAGAEALGLANDCGNLDVRKEANFLQLDSSAIQSTKSADEVLSALLDSKETDFARLTRSAFFRANVISSISTESGPKLAV